MFSLPKRGLAVMKTIRYITLCVCAVATLLEPLAYAQPPTHSDVRYFTYTYAIPAKPRDANAQANLGFMYETGTGIKQNYQEAAKWYKQAATQGNPYAQNNLGALYENGLGVKRDYKMAFKLYKQSAERGLAIGQTNTGIMYGRGRGVQSSGVEAVKWLRKGANQDNALAQMAKQRLKVWPPPKKN